MVKAPDFNLPDQDGKQHTLTDYRGQWVVLYFYPKDSTPGCTTEACSFRDQRDEIAQLGGAVVAAVGWVVAIGCLVAAVGWVVAIGCLVAAVGRRCHGNGYRSGYGQHDEIRFLTTESSAISVQNSR